MLDENLVPTFGAWQHQGNMYLRSQAPASAHRTQLRLGLKQPRRQYQIDVCEVMPAAARRLLACQFKLKLM